MGGIVFDFLNSNTKVFVFYLKLGEFENIFRGNLKNKLSSVSWGLEYFIVKKSRIKTFRKMDFYFILIIYGEI